MTLVIIGRLFSKSAFGANKKEPRQPTHIQKKEKIKDTITNTEDIQATSTTADDRPCSSLCRLSPSVWDYSNQDRIS